jgi:hypothetical protein
MVAKIKSGKSLTGALNYNENKVKQHKAVFIEAARYFKDRENLSFSDKLIRLTDLAGMNQRAKTNAVHISLNFPNREVLPDETLREIVKEYMLGIGFQTQPYLVYRHHDAGHPHIHIVTTNIKRDGERINLHYLGQNESEKARKAIELKFGLIKAQEQKAQRPIPEAEVKVAEYGESETRRMIANVLGATLHSYKFTSVPELNAVLKQFNIQADQGSKDSRMYARGGLIYWILDRQGNKAGVPIKASNIYGKPTLKMLETKFRLNEQLRKPYKAELIKVIDSVLSNPHTSSSFQKALEEKAIQCILRQNAEGRIYGLTFIDQKNKMVFNGSNLGKAYSANLLSAHFLTHSANKFSGQKQNSDVSGNQAFGQISSGNDQLLDILFAPERDDLAALHKFKRKKRKGLNF